MKLKKIVENLDQKVELNEKKAFLQEVAMFKEYGKIIYRTDGMREAAEKIGKNTAFFMTLGGCYPISGIYEDGKICDRHRADVIDYLKTSNVDVIVIGGCWNCYYLTSNNSSIQSNKVELNIALIELKSYLTELRKRKMVYYKK